MATYVKMLVQVGGWRGRTGDHEGRIEEQGTETRPRRSCQVCIMASGNLLSRGVSDFAGNT